MTKQSMGHIKRSGMLPEMLNYLVFKSQQKYKYFPRQGKNQGFFKERRPKLNGRKNRGENQ